METVTAEYSATVDKIVHHSWKYNLDLLNSPAHWRVYWPNHKESYNHEKSILQVSYIQKTYANV